MSTKLNDVYSRFLILSRFLLRWQRKCCDDGFGLNKVENVVHSIHIHSVGECFVDRYWYDIPERWCQLIRHDYCAKKLCPS